MCLWGVRLSEDDLQNVSWLSGVPQAVVWRTLLADYSHGALCCELDLGDVPAPPQRRGSRCDRCARAGGR